LNNFAVAPATDAGTVTVNGQDIPVGTLTIVSPLLLKEHDAQFNLDYTLGKHQIGTRFLFNQETTLFPVTIRSQSSIRTCWYGIEKLR